MASHLKTSAVSFGRSNCIAPLSAFEQPHPSNISFNLNATLIDRGHVCNCLGRQCRFVVARNGLKDGFANKFCLVDEDSIKSPDSLAVVIRSMARELRKKAPLKPCATHGSHASSGTSYVQPQVRRGVLVQPVAVLEKDQKQRQKRKSHREGEWRGSLLSR